jgi:hypothetical protein
MQVGESCRNPEKTVSKTEKNRFAAQSDRTFTTPVPEKTALLPRTEPDREK